MYKIFISYKHSEKSITIAETIEKDVKTYGRLIFQPPMRVFRDVYQLNIGDNLSSSIMKALNNTEYLVYLASPEAAASAWVIKELMYWCSELKRPDKLLIVVIDGTIAIDTDASTINWDQTDCLPAFLKDYIKYEPIYYDMSVITEYERTKAEYKTYINNIVAKVNNVTPEEMYCIETKNYKKNKFFKKLFFALLGLFFLCSILLVM
jgi:hypothetical protein